MSTVTYSRLNLESIEKAILILEEQKRRYNEKIEARKEQYYTRRELMKLLNISLTGFNEWMKSGVLHFPDYIEPTSKVYLWRKKKLQAWAKRMLKDEKIKYRVKQRIIDSGLGDH